jgi:hypothetical protein
MPLYFRVTLLVERLVTKASSKSKYYKSIDKSIQLFDALKQYSGRLPVQPLSGPTIRF